MFSIGNIAVNGDVLMIIVYDKKGFDKLLELEVTSFKSLDLSGANLKDANMVQYDLSGVILRNANLAGADLRLVDFTDADLSGADLTGADLTGAILTNTKMDRKKIIPIISQN